MRKVDEHSKQASGMAKSLTRNIFLSILLTLMLGIGGCASLGGLLGGGSDAGLSISATNVEEVVKIVKDLVEAYKDSKIPIQPTIPTTPPAPPIIEEPDPVIPPEVTFQYEEHGTVGTGNPVTSGPRELFRFNHPGSYYGDHIIVTFDNGRVIPPYTVPVGASRYELPDGFLWKPISDNTNPNTGTKTLAIHGKGGADIQKCSIKFKR